jgi:hypothetical protein
MSQLQHFIENNKKERERLFALMDGLKEADFAKKLPNGWTVSVALAHLAFWDFSQVTRLKAWLEKGTKPPSLDADAVNEALAILSAALPPKEVVKLVKQAAETIDHLIEQLTPTQSGELIGMGLERNIHRALHRQYHLPKIEMAIQG